MSLELLGPRHASVVAARRLTRAAGRKETGLFLVEGPQALREAQRAGVVIEVFTTAEAARRHPDLTGPVTHLVSERTLTTLADAVTPQGLVAVAPCVDVPLEIALNAARPDAPALIAVLVEAADPGNAGAVLRVADAAGCSAVVLAGGVDPHNAKCVRASAGSLWHLPVARCAVADLVPALRAAGFALVATTGSGSGTPLHPDLPLPERAAVLFGNEAHGLPAELIGSGDLCLKVPIFGRAESLNLAAAAAVILYALAWANA